MESPIRRQYLALKQRHPDAILLFRLGDFYETFDGDAQTVSRELDIVLTARDMGQGARVPLAGIPAQSLELHVARLVKRGHRVAICEQLAEAGSVKGLLPRDVVRVVTPGTVTEPALLIPTENNYLAALVVEARNAALATVDVSTGEFAATEVEGAEAGARLLDELIRLQVAELLLPEGAELPARAGARPDAPLGAARALDCPITHTPAWQFDLDEARSALLEVYEVGALDGFGLGNLRAATRAAGALVLYLRDHQRQALLNLRSPVVYSLDTSMRLDDATVESLELWNARGRDRPTLLGVLDATRTPMGARLLRRWLARPLLEMEPLRQRQDVVSALVREPGARARLRELLAKPADLERLAGRVAQRSATPRDLHALRAALRVTPAIREALAEAGSASIRGLAAELPECAGARGLVDAALVDEPPATLGEIRAIRPGFDAELDEIEAGAADARDWLAKLEATERERTGIKGLKVGYHRVFGYYLEVSNAFKGEVPGGYTRKQTLAGGERYITAELQQRESVVLGAQERFERLEREVFAGILATIAREGHDLTRAADTLARLDALCSLAEVAARNRYVCPELVEDGSIHITAGRHPVVEQSVARGAFVPNDAELSATSRQIAIVTGPNMAGKSTFLRQVALIALMAQIGSWVPAEAARIGLVDRVFTRVGARDDVSQGQSTFLVEMLELATILNQATSRSLIVLDEVGRGTSTYDGLAIARATVEYLHNAPRLGAKTLFATHYLELTELAAVLPRVANLNVAVLEEGDRVVFLHRIVPGGADRSYGVHVARIAGIPRAVTRRADEILRELERGTLRTRTSRHPPREMQLSLLEGLLSNPEADGLLEELAELDVLSLTPLEALTRLFDLQERAKACR